MTPTDEELAARYFKALGWTPRADGEWFDSNGNWKERLPNILEHYPDFKKWVLEVMEGEGYGYSIDYCFQWGNEFSDNARLKFIREEIKSNNILHAAVIAATRYFEEKKDE